MTATRITGTGSHVPERIVTNQQMAAWVDTSDEWITTRTGINERHITEGANTSAFASEAARKAMESAAIRPEEIDLVVVATVSPDRFTPTVSCLVQSNLGLKNATCFDLWAGCTGFVFALMTASNLLQSGQFSKALVIGAECLTKLTDWQDRRTCVLFGDGAGAVVVETGEEQGLIKHVTGSDGTRSDVLTIEGPPVNNPLCQNADLNHFIQMEGTEVFKFAVKAIPDSIHEVLAGSGFSLEDVDYVVPHQANNRIIEYVANHLKAPSEKFYANISRFGNTSAASIPIALDEMNRSGLLKKGMRLITVGFGGGLTWGANLFRWTI